MGLGCTWIRGRTGIWGYTGTWLGDCTGKRGCPGTWDVPWDEGAVGHGSILGCGGALRHEGDNWMLKEIYWEMGGIGMSGMYWDIGAVHCDMGEMHWGLECTSMGRDIGTLCALIHGGGLHWEKWVH